MKTVKRALALCLCLMIAFALVPAPKANAVQVKKSGVYGGSFASGKEGIKVTIKGKKLTMKGRPYNAYCEEMWGSSDTILKSQKRVFTLTKKTKCRTDSGKKISLAKVKKHIKSISILEQIKNATVVLSCTRAYFKYSLILPLIADGVIAIKDPIAPNSVR